MAQHDSPDSTGAIDSYPQLLSLAVHEFRTPASVVGGYLHMLQRDTTQPLSDRQRKMIEEAEKACARLVTIVSEMSDIGKIDAGLVKFTDQQIDLFSLVADVAEHVHEAEDRGVILEVRGTATGATIDGDLKRLRIALDAIFRAILREHAGPATIAAERRLETLNGQSSAVIVVAEHHAVQEAYDRPPAGFDEKRGGLGLALPLARRVIERHSGRLWAPAKNQVDDDPLARGSVLIAFPLSSLTHAE